MTREEAVKRLEDYKNVMIESIPSDKMQEALDMAIKALKNQEAEKERIIKELEEKLEQSNYNGTSRRNGKSIAYGMSIAYQEAIEIVKRGGKE